MKPEKTIKAYKLFRTLKSRPGELFPLFIDKSSAVPMCTWIPAQFIPTKGFSNRPGWHAGLLPRADHLLKKNGQMPSNRVWAEVEISADIDWQPIADRQTTKDIRDQVPTKGYYRFKRPGNQGGTWIIGGALKVNRVLTETEVNQILNGR